MDEGQFLSGRRVYGADYEDAGTRPDRTYVELVGGPLDGLLLDVTGWSDKALREGAALRTDLGRYGDTGRSLYEPRSGDGRRFDWQGDTP
jgi:hypothetical protein